MVAVEDLHEAHVGAVGKVRMPLDAGPPQFHGRAFHIGHAQHRVGPARAGGIAARAAPIIEGIADHVAAHIENRQSPAMNWDDSLGNMKALDRWRTAIGVVYQSEKPKK